MTSIRSTLDTIKVLLSQQGCDSDDDSLCHLMRLECLLASHQLEIGLLVLLTAARALEMKASQRANEGDFKTLTIQVAGSKSATAFLAVARQWRDQVAKSIQQVASPAFMLVSIVEPCGSLNALSCCGVPQEHIDKLPQGKRCVCHVECPCGTLA